uniref:Uncharacterized protein n=1 Tax=Fagus sylvatica TaxID=28930 RepID=A0A2N9I2N3_FAGSY
MADAVAQRGDTWHGRVPEAWPRVPRTCCYVLARGDSSRSLAGVWGHVQPPMEAIPMANGISSAEESERGAKFLESELGSPRSGLRKMRRRKARDHCLSGTFSGAWRRVRTPMEAVPPPNGRLAEEDSNGGATLWFRSPEDRVLECECGGGAWAAKPRTPVARGCSIGCLEARVPRLTVLGGAWKLGNSPRSCQNSGKCGSHRRRQLIIPLGLFDNLPVSISLLAKNGSDGFLLNLVETLYHSQRRGVGLDEKMGY